MKQIIRPILATASYLTQKLEIFRRNRVKPQALTPPPDPFSAEQTPVVEQFLDDVLDTTFIDVEASNGKQMDWCLAIKHNHCCHRGGRSASLLATPHIFIRVC